MNKTQYVIGSAIVGAALALATAPIMGVVGFVAMLLLSSVVKDAK